MKKFIVRITLSLILLITALVSPFNETVKIILYVIAYVIAGYDIVFNAIRKIFRGDFLDEDFLMSIASIGALCIGEYPDGVAVMVFFQIGEMLQHIAVEKSRKSIMSMMDLMPDVCNVVRDGNIVEVHPSEVALDEILIVKPGEKIALDGIVIDGTSSLDTSKLTGETELREIYKDDVVLSGSVNISSVLKIKVTSIFEESTANKILDLVENATMLKAKSENFITKFARIYTPIVVFLAIIVAFIPPLILGFDANFSKWLYRALTFLVVSCPCALVISVPLSFFAGIGASAKYNILIKGSSYLEILSKTKTIVFDKTGTLTKGNFKVTKVEAFDISKKDLLYYACSAEYMSNHPIASALKENYDGEISPVLNIEDIPGHGIKAVVDGKEVLCGNQKLMTKFSIDTPDIYEIGTVLYVAIDNKFVGYILINDEIKEESYELISSLKSVNINKVIMLTGDKKEVADNVGEKLGIDEVYSELLPQDKFTKINELIANKSKNELLAFVGDGINDAPALALSDVGISMGSIGSDAAIEASDVVLMNDNPLKIVTLLKISKKTMKIVNQNIIFSIGIKVLVLILSLFGLANMWLAIFADVGVCILAILNAIRIIFIKYEEK